MRADTRHLDDQAAGLRRLATRGPVRVVAVASGKGGVGKTNISVNLAMAMAAGGKKSCCSTPIWGWPMSTCCWD